MAEMSTILSPHDDMGRGKTFAVPDYGLLLLLDYHGRIEYLAEGYYLKFVIRQIAATPARPHGLKYSFTLHNPDGARILWCDNAHGVAPPGKSAKKTVTHDHWHRTAQDAGIPYDFVDAATLLEVFYDKVEQALAARGIDLSVVGEHNVE